MFSARKKSQVVAAGLIWLLVFGILSWLLVMAHAPLPGMKLSQWAKRPARPVNTWFTQRLKNGEGRFEIYPPVCL
jgi:hypothetical protein